MNGWMMYDRLLCLGDQIDAWVDGVIGVKMDELLDG